MTEGLFKIISPPRENLSILLYISPCSLGDELLSLCLAHSLLKFLATSAFCKSKVRFVVPRVELYENIAQVAEGAVMCDVLHDISRHQGDVIDIKFDIGIFVQPQKVNQSNNVFFGCSQTIIHINRGSNISLANYDLNVNYDYTLRNPPKNISKRWSLLCQTLFGRRCISPSEIILSTHELAIASRKLSAAVRDTSREILILNPLSGRKAVRRGWRAMKQWSSAKFSETALLLAEKYPSIKVLVGACAEEDDNFARKLVYEIVSGAAHPNVNCLAPLNSRMLTVREFAAFIAQPRVKLCFGVDTGSNQHLSRCVGKRSLTLFNPDVLAMSSKDKFARSSGPDIWGTAHRSDRHLNISFASSDCNLRSTDIVIAVEQMLRIDL